MFLLWSWGLFPPTGRDKTKIIVITFSGRNEGGTIIRPPGPSIITFATMIKTTSMEYKPLLHNKSIDSNHLHKKGWSFQSIGLIATGDLRLMPMVAEASLCTLAVSFNEPSESRLSKTSCAGGGAAAAASGCALLSPFSSSCISWSPRFPSSGW